MVRRCFQIEFSSILGARWLFQWLDLSNAIEAAGGGGGGGEGSLTLFSLPLILPTSHAFCTGMHCHVSVRTDCFHTRAKVRNLNFKLNCAIQIIIRMTVFWTVCTQNYIAMRILKCPIQITHRGVILCTHSPKFCHSNYASQCNFAYTRSKIPSFELSFKLRNSN